MTATRCADPSFGLSPHALAILQLLAGTEPLFADFDSGDRHFDVEISTYPWFNGFERGIALVVQKSPKGPCVVITFGECKESDHLFSEHWMLDEAPANGPRVEDPSQGVCRALFKRGRFEEVVEHVMDVMSEFYERVSSPPQLRAHLHQGSLV